MNKIKGLSLVYLDGAGNKTQSDSAIPSITRNIERMALKYQKFIDSEILEDQANQNEHAEKVKELQDSHNRKKKR